MKILLAILITAVLLAGWCMPAAASDVMVKEPGIYVPIGELPKLVKPDDKAVLMAREDFEKLLSEAKAAKESDDTVKLAYIGNVEYEVNITGDKAAIKGTLEVVSTCQKPVFVDLGFAGFGLNSVLLDSTAAPLGYNEIGHLGVIVKGNGTYSLQISAAARLKELASGGMQFGIRIPEAVSGQMKLSAGGDVEVHSSVPATKGEYLSKDDKTVSELTVGGMRDITVVLLGNGSREQEKSILLGQGATTITLSKTQEVVSSLYTVQVLRKSVKELDFRVPSGWTVTDVICPGLVKWSIGKDLASSNSRMGQMLRVRFSSAKKGQIVLHVKAIAARDGETWRAGGLQLKRADFERGYLMVITDQELGVRGESISGARREDVSMASYITGMANAGGARLYFTWGTDWKVELALADVELRRSVEERQQVVVDRNGVKLIADFEVTAVDREMFVMQFDIADSLSKWDLASVTVNGRKDKFQWRIEEKDNSRQLTIELPKGVATEKLAKVSVVMQHVPADWNWSDESVERLLNIPLIRCYADTVSGLTSILTADDLAVEQNKIPSNFEALGAGRMSEIGFAGNVKLGYSYKKPADAGLSLKVSRLTGRIAADSIGVISASVRQLNGTWRITYVITRGRVNKLYLLADRTIGEALSISSGTVAISSKSIVNPGPDTYAVSDRMAQGYNLWELVLDDRFIGNAVVDVRYERQADEGEFSASLIRPVCAGEINELLAIESSEDIALDIDVTGGKEIDAIDLPALPAAVNRILAAYRLNSLNSETGDYVGVGLTSVVHDNYDIAKTIILRSEITSHVDVDGSQRVEGVFRVANAGRQYLKMKLPEGAELWSLRVDGKTVKPQTSSTGDLQVAIGKLRKPVNVKIVFSYEPQSTGLEGLALAGVEFGDIQINEFVWNVVPPVGYKVVDQQTDMETASVARVKPAYKSLAGILARVPRMSSIFKMACNSELKPGLDISGGERVLYDGEVIDESVEIHKLNSSKDRVKKESLAQRMIQIPQPDARPSDKGRYLAKQQAAGVRLVAEGGRTLPVDIIGNTDAGPTASFRGFGREELVVEFGEVEKMTGWYLAGMILSLALGAYLLKRSFACKIRLTILVLVVTSLAATWVDLAAYFANGAFVGALIAAGVFVIIGILRPLLGWIGLLECGSAASRVAAAVVFVMILSLTGQSQAGSRPNPSPVGPTDWIDKGDAIMGYVADANEASSVLVPYHKYVELWNAAHPQDQIDISDKPSRLTIAGVRYDVKVGAKSVQVTLTAELKVHGKRATELVLDVKKLAVQNVTLDGKPAALGVDGAGQTVLLVDGDFSGKLEMKAVGKCDYFGSRGSAVFSIPALPGAVVGVELPTSDLELEVDGIDGVVERIGEKNSNKWQFAPGMKRDLTLRWLPPMGTSGADKTLSAVCNSDVYAFHWAMVGVTKIDYSFSGGEHDRFAFLVPEGVSITGVSGTNVKDWQAVGKKNVDGSEFRYVRVRLHRAAKKKHQLTVRWLSSHGKLEKAQRLYLVRAGDVSRESGMVTLYQAGGMKVKVAGVSGGRRTSINDRNVNVSAAETTRPVARYYWPYRPFSISVEMIRDRARAKVNLDQLVRIEDDRVQLLVQADMESTSEKLFGASFLLPEGYELLSVVGGAVERYYEQRKGGENLVHVKFFSGENKTQLAMMLVSDDLNLADFKVPVVKFSDSYGIKADKYAGRIAVQPVASMEGVTAESTNVKAVTPSSLRGWLDSPQVRAVHFAWSYEGADPTVKLNIRRKPTRKNVEVFAGVAVKPTAVGYTYRLRYRISGSPVDKLSFSLPSEYASLVEATSPAMRSVAKTAGNDKTTTWTVTLLSQVTGTVDVAVNMAIPIEESTKDIVLPRIQTDSYDSYRVIVAVQNMSRHSIDIAENGRFGLDVMSVSDQQKLMGAEMRKSLQYVFESFADQWSLRLDFKAAKRAERMKAIVDLLAMTTVVDRNGNCRYEVKITIQNRSKQFLKIKTDEDLRLWSASVAGRPVKPVVSADLGPGEVLIPLLKTSLGGLPYDVNVYYAGKVVKKFSTISKLTPPAISIVDVPVSRTTWSMRLPAGFKYMRYSGNMSKVAGLIEQKILESEVMLDQIRRLDQTQRDFGSYSRNVDEAAKQNFDFLNKKAVNNIIQTERYLEANRTAVSKEEYARLKDKLSGQKALQEVVFTDNAAYNGTAAMEMGNDLNAWINVSNTNSGFAESERNSRLQDKPKFIGENEIRQVQRLEKQLKTTVGNELEGKSSNWGGMLDSKSDSSVDNFSSSVLGLKGDKEAEKADKVLREVSRFNAKQMDAQAVQVRKQLSQVIDNRASRYYSRQKGFGVPNNKLVQMEQTQMRENSAPAQRVRNAPGRNGRGGYGAGGPNSNEIGYGGYGGGQGQATGQGRGGMMDGIGIGGGSFGPSASPRGGATITNGQIAYPGADDILAEAHFYGGDMNGAAPGQGVAAYVSGGTYSLPVSLPSGGVQIDFSRPTGGAVLSIWAVDAELLGKIYSTAAIIVSLLIFLAAIKFWPRPTTDKGLAARRIAGYVILLAVSLYLLEIAGCIAAAVLILLLEIGRRCFAAISANN